MLQVSVSDANISVAQTLSRGNRCGNRDQAYGNESRKKSMLSTRVKRAIPSQNQQVSERLTRFSYFCLREFHRRVFMEQIFSQGFDRVFAACKRALSELDFSIEFVDKNEGTLSASTSTSFFSWGETIDINVQRSGRGTKVIVDSNSKAQLISWGKNDDNEEAILNKIEEILIR